MRPFLQTLAGLALAVGLLAIGWALTGRPTVDAARIGSGFQAVGAAVEAYALLRIVWKPWVLPSLAKVKAAYNREVRRTRRRLHHLFPSLFPAIATGVDLGAANATGVGTMQLSGELKRGGTLEERVTRIEQDLDRTVNDLAQRLKAQEDQIKKGDDAVAERLAEAEVTALRIRTDDAVRLLLGISLSLIGAAWGSVGQEAARPSSSSAALPSRGRMLRWRCSVLTTCREGRRVSGFSAEAQRWCAAPPCLPFFFPLPPHCALTTGLVL